MEKKGELMRDEGVDERDQANASAAAATMAAVSVGGRTRVAVHVRGRLHVCHTPGTRKSCLLNV